MQLDALVPCYNEYPNVILSVRTLKAIADHVVVVDSSDDLYTWKALQEHFGDDEQVTLEHSAKWLDWGRARQRALELSVGSHQLWADANDFYSDHMRDPIRHQIENLKEGEVWCPGAIRLVFTFTSTIPYQNNDPAIPYEHDPFHFACRRGTFASWGIAPTTAGAVALNAQGEASGVQTRCRQQRGMTMGCYFHGFSLGTLERAATRGVMREYLKSKHRPAESPKKYLLHRDRHASATADAIAELHRLVPLEGEADRWKQPIFRYPSAIESELLQQEFYRFEYRDDLPCARWVLHDGTPIEYLFHAKKTWVRSLG
jgi:hypothetical protein